MGLEDQGEAPVLQALDEPALPQGLGTVKRLRDLLFQAIGILERVQHRLDLLKADEPPVGGYAEPAVKGDETEQESPPSATGPGKTLKK